MRYGFTKYASFLVLVLSLVFFTGIASAAVALHGSPATDVCCEHDAEKQTPVQTPVDDSECSDMGCICLSCSVSVLSASIDLDTSFPKDGVFGWSQRMWAPSDHVTSIDYPPEFS